MLIQPWFMSAQHSATQRPRILVCDPIHPDGITLLQTHAEVELVGDMALTPTQLAAVIGDYDAVIIRSRTNLPASVIEQGLRLRVIGRAGVGLDNIAIAVAEARNIEVLNCPDATTVSVAEHTIALMLGVARHLSRADQGLKAGRWEKNRIEGSELAGKTLGIIGFGRIGREVAKRAKAFEMELLVNQTRFTPELAQTWQVEQVDLGDLLRRSDFVSLHVPMRPSNAGLIGAGELALMRRSAYLINTARGGIVDEAALLAALDAGQIAGAALDVFVGEPRPDLRLVNHPRVLATPHIGANTVDAQRRAAIMVAEQVLAVFRRRSAAETLALRVVPVEMLLPHEYHNPARVARLAERIAADGLLANPPLVASLGDERYVVLDGATRVTAFRQLGYPHLVVQVVDPARDNLQLYTWYHAVRGSNSQEFLQLVRGVPGLQITEMAVEGLARALWERSALAYVITPDQRGFLLVAAQSPGAEDEDGWLTPFNELVNRYGAWGEVERTLVTDVETLRSQHHDLVGLVVFPQFTPEMIMRLVGRGRLLPAGITRFVAPGRILRLNAPLSVLASAEPLSKKREWLDQLVQSKLAGRGVRYYQEPVVLLDE
jgi:phosphoglycerate dehydrogenase-like enzyme